ncbi:uncharacterized protein ColSpa_05661 [Colletotrichum spaethianum]|uniref:Cell surface protein n=1 Tax=Colletotrichum spaethianum TaxID=700344 RepID=A0AA37LF83_9PEZI|nr:uncharacterized protein ColSpa_05661 [Colletotrichum spaethianum]GKT45480.1 hypothetical protein ColSpa_05661 [Colletotrichum spaethianum]
MRSQSLLVAALAASVSAHGTLLSVTGSNGVTMPGLTIADGTPRDCTSNGCGSQADTAIIRDREIASGQVGPLGRTQGNGPVDASVMIDNFMGGAAAPQNNGKAAATGEEDNIPNFKRAELHVRQGLAGLFGGAGGGKAKTQNGPPSPASPPPPAWAPPRINQDGAGPLTADVDGTSGGTKEEAMQKAQVTTNVPGLGIQGLSLATNAEFPVKVQMPAGMTCDATVGMAKNVCVVRVRNGAAAGPFGGSAAFTQTAAGRKRAIAYRLKKRMELNNRA